MKKFLALYSIALVLCFFSLTIFMTGCRKDSEPKKATIWEMLASKKKPSKPELIKLKNGVFVYKDNTPTETPPDYNGKDPFNNLETKFGPSKVNFNGEKSL